MQFVMRSIPYPRLLVFLHGSRCRYGAYQLLGLVDREKVTGDEFSAAHASRRTPLSGRRCISGNCALPTSLNSTPTECTTITFAQKYLGGY